MTETRPPAPVYLVGGGPGDPGLITLRAVECLSRADVVLYDYLVNPALLEHASASAELIRLGHHSTGRALSPEQITDQMVQTARSGKTVVRLKGGDPLVFGRGSDETRALREGGVPYEIVPGITVGLAVAAYCEIPLTHHDHASAVALVAGRERDAKAESHLDYRALADFPGTLVFYMGVRQAADWSGALIQQGRSPETPVAIVPWCTRARQQTIRCSLATVAEVVGERGLRPPAVIVVGKAVDLAPQLSWFDQRPLFGTRFLVAGSPITARRLRDQLTTLGAEVLTQPAVRITDPPAWEPVDAALDALDQYDWLVFTSGNAVDYLVRRLFDRGGDVRRLGLVKLVAIGSATARRLGQYHVQADLMPESFAVEALARSLVGDGEGGRFLLARASRDRPRLADALAHAGAQVDQIAVYHNADVESPDPDVAMALRSDEIDWIAVTSAVTAQSLARLYGNDLGRARLASISPMTSAALRELGCEPAAEASPHTVVGMIDTILRAGGKRG